LGLRCHGWQEKDKVRPLFCKSDAMLEVARRIERASQVHCPVLICGEPGAGKKLTAEAIHQQSPRAGRPLVVVRSEHALQRFLSDIRVASDARSSGVVGNAPVGTLVVEEIAGLTRRAQARLLHVAERRRANGSLYLQERTADFRLLATTRYDPVESVVRGVLREDMPYRLGVLTIDIPPLRERQEDIPFLVRHMLAKSCAVRGKLIPSVDSELMQFLVEQPWPGNGRQLDTLMRQILPENDVSALKMEHLRRSDAAADAFGRLRAARSSRVAGDAGRN
jgi:DNA-binding NtrC family response regulator